MPRRLLLAALLAAGFALPARAAEIDALLPAETESIAYVNVRQVIDSELIKKYALGNIKQMIAGNEDAQKALKELGIDPLKDINKVTIGSWGKGADDMQVVGVVRGKFDPTKLMAAAEKAAKNDGDKIQVVTEGDVKLVKFTAENQPKPFFAAPLNEGAIIVGNDKKLVVKTLAAGKEKATKVAIKKELGELLLKQDEKASMFVVGLVDGKTIPELPPNANIPGVDSAKLGKQLQKMKTFAMTLRVTEDVGLEVLMGMEDKDAADDFGATVDQLVGTVKQFLPLVGGQPQFKPLADEVAKTLKSKVKEKEVGIVLKLSADSIGKATGGGD